jgi:hypothetical protein
MRQLLGQDRPPGGGPGHGAALDGNARLTRADHANPTSPFALATAHAGGRPVPRSRDSAVLTEREASSNGAARETVASGCALQHLQPRPAMDRPSQGELSKLMTEDPERKRRPTPRPVPEHPVRPSEPVPVPTQQARGKRDARDAPRGLIPHQFERALETALFRGGAPLFCGEE